MVVTSYPDVLFNGGNRTILEGSQVWLYCTVSSRDRAVAVTWTKDNIPLVQDVPHIRMRRSDLEVPTYILMVTGFRSSDSGTYQCSAEDARGRKRTNGPTLTLTGK
jgi:hypothetical protein